MPTTIFSDTFTDTNGVILQSHTPTLGTSWTEIYDGPFDDYRLTIQSNQCAQTTDTNNGCMYTADATYPSADYDVTFTLVGVTSNNDRPIYIFVRLQDQENMYAVQIKNNTTACSLYKKVSGTWTAIGSLFGKPANGSVCKLEIVGTALKFYDDGVVIASATVSDISAAGKAGIGAGGGSEMVTSGDDTNSANIIDTLSVNDLAGTIFYLPSTGAAAVSPGFDAGWEETGSADRIKMVTTKIASAMTDKSATTLITAGDTLCRQYVSDALEAQTINSDIRIYARAFETLATVDALSRIVLKIVSNDGATVRGTLLALGDFSSGAEWNTALRNKSFADGDTPSSVAAQAGDRLCLETGFNHAAVISSAAINFGDDSATDLPQDETTTAANNPWLRIGQVLTFYTPKSLVPIRYPRSWASLIVR